LPNASVSISSAAMKESYPVFLLLIGGFTPIAHSAYLSCMYVGHVF